MSAHENFYSKNLIWFYSSRKEIHLIASTSVVNFKILYTNPPTHCCPKSKGNENGKQVVSSLGTIILAYLVVHTVKWSIRAYPVKSLHGNDKLINMVSQLFT